MDSQVEAAKRPWAWITACFLAACVIAPAVRAGDDLPAVTGKNNSIQLSGVAWVAYRYKLADDPSYEAPGSFLGAAPKASPHEAAGRDLKGASSFDIDRVYLTADYTINPRYSWETVIEASNTGGTQSLFLKKAFLCIKDPFHVQGTLLRFGQIGHPLVEQEVEAWGYRSVSRTPVDRYLGISSVWDGVEGDGAMFDGHLELDGAVLNEKPYNAPDDTISTVSSKYKSFSGRLTFIPLPADPKLKGLKLTLFGQYGAKDAPLAGAKNGWTFLGPSAKNNNTRWYGVFPFWKADDFTVGFEYVGKTDLTALTATTHKSVGSHYLGGFGSYAVTRKDRVFARLDRYDPDIYTANDGYLIGMLGLSHQYVKGARTILDMEYDKFDAKQANGSDSKPDVTVTARVELTL